jgi:hypothetical protein
MLIYQGYPYLRPESSAAGRNRFAIKRCQEPFRGAWRGSLPLLVIPSHLHRSNLSEEVEYTPFQTLNGLFREGAMPDCMTCKWIKWSASIPLLFLFGAGGFLILAQVAVAQDNAPAVLLDLYLATWSYILAVAGVALLTGWWLWRWLHTRTAHALRAC